MSKANKRERQRQNREQRRQYEEQLAKRRRTFKTARTFALVALPVIAVGVVLNLTNSTDTAAARVCAKAAKPAAKADGGLEAPPLTIDPNLSYVADVQTNCGSFTITLDAGAAPQSVNNFVFLARQGYYDGLTFHRVSKDFVAQGGDPTGDGLGGPGYTLPAEPPTVAYEKGSVAMAVSAKGVNGSQFFVVTSAAGARNLGGPPYQYPSLGTVTSGIKTIDTINRLGSTSSDLAKQKPRETIVISRITITEVPPATP